MTEFSRAKLTGAQRSSALQALMASDNPNDELWLRLWYAAIRRLPSARGCNAELVFLPQPVHDGHGRLMHGQLIDRGEGTPQIVCALSPDAEECLATLIHEVAHFAQNQRHRRHHGYSWRRTVVQLFRELTGLDIVDDARAYRNIYGVKLARAEALDLAMTTLLGDDWPAVYARDDHVDLVVGTKRHEVFQLP